MIYENKKQKTEVGENIDANSFVRFDGTKKTLQPRRPFVFLGCRGDVEILQTAPFYKINYSVNGL